MPFECYTLEYDGKRLRFAPASLENMPCQPVTTGERTDVTLKSPWEFHSSLGDDNRIWCEAYRVSNQPGGFFIVRDFDEVLLLARAETHLAFLQGLSRFARLTTYTRYAADIFEHDEE